MKIQERDSKGRFSGIRDTEIDAWIAAENLRAEKLIKMCDLLEFKSESFGIRKLESGNYRIDRDVKSSVVGIALGLVLALDKRQKKIRELLFVVADAAEIPQALKKLKEGEDKLNKTKSRSARA